MIRWGILGCGDVCEVKSGPAFQKSRGSQLVAVMRRDAHRCADFAARHDVPFHTTSARELIENPDVDAVYIATPPGQHLELALAVCAAKKPCYVEKPMARSFAESAQMLEAFRAANVPLFVAFYRRGLPRFQTVKTLLEHGEIGEISGVSYRYLSPSEADLDPQNLPWRLRAHDAGAGLFYDLGSHLLDVFDFWFGPLENVAGLARNRATPQIEVEDSAAMSFEAAGAPGVAQWNFAAHERADFIEIWGENGKISLSCFSGEPVRLQNRRGEQFFEGANPPHVHGPLVQTICDELNGVGAALSTGESALRTMRVMDRVLGRI